MIELENVYKTFGKQVILQDISFSLQKGQILGLVGPNGSGKTTLIRLLNGVIAPNDGMIRINGLDPVQEGRTVRLQSGTLTEEAGLYGELTANQNLRFFSKLYGGHDPDYLEQLLERLRMTDYQHQKVGTFSTGMKKRIALAKVLMHQPDILFLDEPTNGLDPEGIDLIMKLIKELNQTKQITVLICSHILSQLEFLCDHYVFIQDGRILDEGGRKQLEERYITQIQLRVETSYTHPACQAATYSYQPVADGEIVFTLPHKQAASQVLRYLTNQSDVYSAEILNRDLETIYFEVKKRHGG